MTTSKETGSDLNVKFGQEARDLLYAFDKRTTFVNHGSYGVAPQQLLKKRLDLIKEQESSPDRWFRFTSPLLAEKNIDALAKFLKVDSQQLTLCANATDALNIVIKSLNYREDNIEEEVILASRYTYNAILNTLHYTANYRSTDLEYKHFGAVKIFQAPCVYPISSVDQVLDAYDKMCRYLIQEKHYRIKLVVLDHISSETATLYPVKEIIQIVRKWSQKTIVVIDGKLELSQSSPQNGLCVIVLCKCKLWRAFQVLTPSDKSKSS